MSRIVLENLSTVDRAELLTSVLDCDATTISDCIFKIPALKLVSKPDAIWHGEICCT